MDEKIKEALHKAYTGEAKAALRLKVFAGFMVSLAMA